MDAMLLPVIKLVALIMCLTNVFLLQGMKLAERKSLGGDVNGSWLSTMIMKWFILKLGGSRPKQKVSAPQLLKVLPENECCYSTPKMRMEGVGVLKKLGWSQRSFIKSAITFVRNIIMIDMMF